jgi:hypothetical protein
MACRSTGAATAVVLLTLVPTACGQGDPFIGTWAVDSDLPPLAVIAKGDADGEYLVTLASGTGYRQLRFTRDGDAISLVRSLRHPTEGTVDRTFRFTQAADGELTYFEGEPGLTLAEVRVERLSDATVSPVASTEGSQ